MTSCCEGCGSPMVRKVTAVVNAGTGTGSLAGGANYTTSTELANQIGLPAAPERFANFTAFFIALACSLLLVGIFGVAIVYMIVHPIIQSMGFDKITAEDVRDVTLPATYVLSVFILWSILKRENNQLRRARARRIATYDMEWYCGACDSIYIPGDVSSVCPASQANDYS